jgi:hypothetical protein
VESYLAHPPFGNQLPSESAATAACRPALNSALSSQANNNHCRPKQTTTTVVPSEQQPLSSQVNNNALSSQAKNNALSSRAKRGICGCSYCRSNCILHVALKACIRARVHSCLNTPPKDRWVPPVPRTWGPGKIEPRAPFIARFVRDEWDRTTAGPANTRAVGAAHVSPALQRGD